MKFLSFRHDSLSIYDGGSIESPMFGRYCGDSIPTDKVSTTNQIFIHFKTNEFVTLPGFQLEYRESSKFVCVMIVSN